MDERTVFVVYSEPEYDPVMHDVVFEIYGAYSERWKAASVAYALKAQFIELPIDKGFITSRDVLEREKASCANG